MIVTSELRHSNENNLKTLATKEDLVNVKADMIKWFLAFFMALALMIIGLYFKK